MGRWDGESMGIGPVRDRNDSSLSRDRARPERTSRRVRTGWLRQIWHVGRRVWDSHNATCRLGLHRVLASDHPGSRESRLVAREAHWHVVPRAVWRAGLDGRTVPCSADRSFELDHAVLDSCVDPQCGALHWLVATRCHHLRGSGETEVVEQVTDWAHREGRNRLSLRHSGSR